MAHDTRETRRCAVCEVSRATDPSPWHHTPSMFRGELLCPECFLAQSEPNEDGLTPGEWLSRKAEDGPQDDHHLAHPWPKPDPNYPLAEND